MNRIIALAVLLSAGFALAQAPQIHPGATVYIEPMNGYETYLAAAFAKKQVPLIVVTERSKADFIVTSTISQRSPNQSAVVINNTTNINGKPDSAFDNGWKAGAQHAANRGSTTASISVADVHSSQVVFAYSVGKSANTNQLQSAAEACAKHLKEFMAKVKK